MRSWRVVVWRLFCEAERKICLNGVVILIDVIDGHDFSSSMGGRRGDLYLTSRYWCDDLVNIDV